MKIEVYEAYPHIDANTLVSFENELSIKLPNDYKEFMLCQNGGVPKICDFDLPSGLDSSVVNYFYPFGDMRGNIRKKNYIFDGELPSGFITIGCDSGGNQILIGVTGQKKGRVYFWYHDVNPEEENPMHFLANTFTEFLEMLK
jgi:hypothetical protein